jgi:hypothetical protein
MNPEARKVSPTFIVRGIEGENILIREDKDKSMLNSSFCLTDQKLAILCWSPHWLRMLKCQLNSENVSTWRCPPDYDIRA